MTVHWSYACHQTFRVASHARCIRGLSRVVANCRQSVNQPEAPSSFIRKRRPKVVSQCQAHGFSFTVILKGTNFLTNLNPAPMRTHAGRYGPIETDPGKIDQVLFDFRKDFWTHEPEEGSAGHAPLAGYFASPGRVAFITDAACPMSGAIAATVLASHGSAAWLDGRPYEIYHHGVAFTTFLVGQAFHVAAIGRTVCTEVLGPNEDLRVCIPKKEWADTPAGQRPLQLPITLRRIIGSAPMDIVGPIIEPMLSPHTAAKRGVSCGPNVATAFGHLESIGHPLCLPP